MSSLYEEEQDIFINKTRKYVVHSGNFKLVFHILVI